MSNTESCLDQVRSKIAADDNVLTEARKRRDLVLDLASGFAGWLRSFRSGSLAHLTVNRPVRDADGGIVLDRRHHPELGPDGEGEGPSAVVGAVRDHLEPRIRATYSKAKAVVTKHAIKVTFDEPVTVDEDPSVDLIVGLTRAEDDALWIPNTENNDWDPSDPEQHTKLLTSGSEGLARTRRHAIRLAKAHNYQFEDPAVSSFNLEAIALTAVAEGMTLPEALLAIWTMGADQLASGLTPDPAEVSPPIKVANRDMAVRRMRAAANGLKTAIDQDADEDAVRNALAAVFFDFIEPAQDSSSGLAASLRSGAPLSVGASGVSVGATAGGVQLKNTRSSGEG